MQQEGLFGSNASGVVPPLADRMRPQSLAQFVGQSHLLAPGKPLRRAIESGALHSMIFWGPPGTGKTTLARLLARTAITISAVLAGVKEIREAVERARMHRAQAGRGTVLFVDEVHRFNKAQQDAFLPFVEDGTLLFVGATTENPSFELNSALLSRARVYVLKSLTRADIRELIDAALTDVQRGLGEIGWDFSELLRNRLAEAADGDGRRALNLLEIVSDLAVRDGAVAHVDEALLNEVVRGGVRRFDKQGELFYDQISALHKSVRGSAPDAALYWLARMLDGGCEPLYIARRAVRMATEDVGNADPRALQLAINAWDVVERLGSPEGELALAQAITYMAVVPKSNAVYVGYNQAMEDARRRGTLEVPVHLRNAPTKLMKELGYGKTYRYAHDEPEAYAAGETYFPEGMDGVAYYHPVPRGLEAKFVERLAYLRGLDRQAKEKK